MMEQIVVLLSWICALSGCFFYVVGALGLIRMPEFFTRMHALSVSDSVGVPLLLLALILQSGWNLNSARLLLILIVLLYGGTVVTHALARAALFAGMKPFLVKDQAGLHLWEVRKNRREEGSSSDGRMD